MRISVRPDDPGYETWQKIGFARVYLDGVEIKGCIVADDEKGEIIQYARDDEGRLTLNSVGDELVEITRTGTVRIEVIV